LSGDGTAQTRHDVFGAFIETVVEHPERPALVHNDRITTYGQLAAQVESAAAALGPRPGVVGLPPTRSPATIVALLGVWAAGGTYCPIDPTFPPARQQAMAAVTGCRTVLAPTAGLPALHGARHVGLHDQPRTGGAGAIAEVAPEHPAYILFTSGSTGVPKPVLTPRRAITAVVRSLRDLFGLSPTDRVLQFASLNWDTCFEEILPTLTTGAALVFDDEAHTGSFPRLLRMIERTRVSVLDLPTAFWHELVRHLAEERLGLPETVRLVVTGGEAIDSARLADWCDLPTGQIRLLNTYGCTETTLITHAVDLHGPQAPRFDPWNTMARVPIGWPLPHVREYVDNGELLIGGPSVALGYPGMPEATEARFVTIDGAGPYFRTGDRVTRSEDGMLVHHGRLDQGVKVRGILVDPAEVEARIAGHPGVKAVAVAGVTVAERTMLAAYVVPRTADSAGSLDTDLYAYLRARVPSHLVPGRISVVPTLVYTPSGKVDRIGSHQRHAADHRAKEAIR